MYKILVHLKESDSVMMLIGSSFDQTIKIEQGVIVVYKTEGHSYIVPLDNIAYIEYIKEVKE